MSLVKSRQVDLERVAELGRMIEAEERSEQSE